MQWHAKSILFNKHTIFSHCHLIFGFFKYCIVHFQSVFVVSYPFLLLEEFCIVEQLESCREIVITAGM